ncbi:MAG: right-handed parallel beta-helix repeat-containing protein [Candidatus Marinimicrobia bacterium]|nr:right-handed parallel beta-helix repeat-containing protein [FCB group bacterium]MBL7025452.1 right-handed parallel beta-helix repeat-containing protein [Candidatus Neomarinimicrobiota bacterium]
MRNKIFLLLLLLSNLMSQTLVSGNVSGVWDMQGNPYRLTANCIVAFGDTLIIDDGVGIDLDSSFEFRVQGVLFATGVLFHNGGSVRGDNGLLDMNNCAFNELDGGIKIISGRARLHGCRIDDTAETGISFSNVDSSYVRNSHISNCGDYGIKILQSDEVEVSGCQLIGNSVNDFNHPALFIDSCSPQVIENNIIENNHGQGVGVWTLTSVAAPVIRGNFIRGNYTGITVVSAPAYILDNVIVANYQEGNFNSGAGIYAGYASSVGIVMGNFIGGNYYGVSLIVGASPNLGDMVNDYPGDDGLNLFYDNSFEGQTWHIWNDTSSPIMAQNNYWLGLDLSEVDATLYDNEEGGGEIIFEPIYAAALPEPPDINDDGVVNILDVVLLIEGIVGMGVPDPVTFYLSDINHDFDINVRDVTALIEIVVE